MGNAEIEPHDTDEERDPAGYLSLVRGAGALRVNRIYLVDRHEITDDIQLRVGAHRP